MFLKCSVSVFYISLRSSLITELQLTDSFRVLHAVESLNIKHELRQKRVKQFCIMWTSPDVKYFLVCQLKIVFYFLHELKQRSSDVTFWH